MTAFELVRLAAIVALCLMLVPIAFALLGALIGACGEILLLLIGWPFLLGRWFWRSITPDDDTEDPS